MFSRLTERLYRPLAKPRHMPATRRSNKKRYPSGGRSLPVFTLPGHIPLELINRQVYVVLVPDMCHVTYAKHVCKQKPSVGSGSLFLAVLAPTRRRKHRPMAFYVYTYQFLSSSRVVTSCRMTHEKLFNWTWPSWFADKKFSYGLVYYIFGISVFSLGPRLVFPPQKIYPVITICAARQCCGCFMWYVSCLLDHLLALWFEIVWPRALSRAKTSVHYIGGL